MTTSHSCSLVYSIPLHSSVTVHPFVRLRTGIRIISSVGPWTDRCYYEHSSCLGAHETSSLFGGISGSRIASSWRPCRVGCNDSAERMSEALIPLSSPTSRVQTFQLYAPTSPWCFLLATLVSVFGSNVHVSNDQSLSLFRCDWVDFVEASVYFFLMDSLRFFSLIYKNSLYFLETSSWLVIGSQAASMTYHSQRELYATNLDSSLSLAHPPPLC